jgi:diguanylate cyclase
VVLHDCAPVDAMHVAERVRLHLLEAAGRPRRAWSSASSIGITRRRAAVVSRTGWHWPTARSHAKRQGKNTASYGE